MCPEFSIRTIIPGHVKDQLLRSFADRTEYLNLVKSSEDQTLQWGDLFAFDANDYVQYYHELLLLW